MNSLSEEVVGAKKISLYKEIRIDLACIIKRREGLCYLYPSMVILFLILEAVFSL